MAPQIVTQTPQGHHVLPQLSQTNNNTVIQTLVNQSTNQELTQPLINYLKQLGLSENIISQMKQEGLSPHILQSLKKLEMCILQAHQEGANQQVKKDGLRPTVQNRTVSSILKNMRCNNGPPPPEPLPKPSTNNRTPVSQLLKNKRDRPPANLRSISLQNSPVGFNYPDNVQSVNENNNCDPSTIDVPSRLAAEQQLTGVKQKIRHRSASAAVSSQPAALRQQLMIGRKKTMQQNMPPTTNGSSDWEKMFMQSFSDPRPKEFDQKSAALASTLTSDIAHTFLSNLKPTDSTVSNTQGKTNLDVLQILHELQQNITAKDQVNDLNSSEDVIHAGGTYINQHIYSQPLQQTLMDGTYNRSGSSTPASVLSPGSLPSRSCGPSPTVDPGGNVFTPINISSFQATTADTILRPQAQRQPHNNIDNSIGVSPNAMLGADNTSCFVDCNQFAPVSSIRPPVKRVGRSGRGGPNSKRSRHHSASALTKKSKVQALKLPLYQTVQCDSTQNIVSSNNYAHNIFPISQALDPLLSPSAQSSYVMTNRGEQQYSPEMSEIMATNKDPMGNSGNTSYRSQSVPVPEQPFHDTDSDFFSLSETQERNINLFMNTDNDMNSTGNPVSCHARRDISGLLSNKPVHLPGDLQTDISMFDNSMDNFSSDSNPTNQLLLDEQHIKSDPMVSGLGMPSLASGFLQ